MSKSLFVFSVVLLVMLFPVRILAGFLQGEPAPEMESFWILETGFNHKIIASDAYRESSKWLITSELGYMKNKNAKTSFGGTLYLGLHDNGSSFGVRARYRRWLSTKPYTSLDFSLGIALSSTDNVVQPKFPGLIATVAFNIRDVIAFSIQQEFSRYSAEPYFIGHGDVKESGYLKNTYIGIQGGSYLGVAASAAIGGFFMLAVSSFN